MDENDQRSASESPSGGISEGEFLIDRLTYKPGYQITGMSRAARWEVLTGAVPKLGLKQVAENIANHIRLRKTQVDGAEKYRHAIGEWEHDLARLRSIYYRGSRANFQWPSSSR